MENELCCVGVNSAHSPTFPSLHLRYSSFSNPSFALPTSQFILQPFCCFTYVTAHSPTLLLLLLSHRLFTWRAAHATTRVAPLLPHQPNAPSLIPLPIQGWCIFRHPDDLHTFTSNLTKAITSHGYPVLLIKKQLFCGLHQPTPSPLHPITFLTIMYYRNLHRLEADPREGFHILFSDPSTKNHLTTSCQFPKTPNLHQLIINTSLHPHRPATPLAPNPARDSGARFVPRSLTPVLISLTP